MTKIVTTHIVDDEPVKTEHEIENATNFCVIVHQQGLKVEVPEFVEVDPQDTIRCMSEMTQKQWEWISKGELFRHLWQEAFDPADRTDPPKSIEVLNMGDMGLRHMAGIIVLGCEACMQGKSVFFRNPETYLHPKTERYIATMLKKMLDLFGKRGTVTKTNDAPEAYIPENFEDGEPLSEVMNEAAKKKEAAEQTDREQALFWLQCMEPEKAIVQLNGERLTVGRITEEVNNNTDIGRWFIDQYVRLRDGS
jgi:hypothetical protein